MAGIKGNHGKGRLSDSDGVMANVTSSPGIFLTLTGGPGNDTLVGGAADDILFGMGGNDNLYGNDGNDELYGGSGGDYLNGGIGNDRLDGGTGDDFMEGGAGNDTYNVDSAWDMVSELQSGGIDRVLSTVNHSLMSNVENLTLTGKTAVYGTGNALDNIIIGNSASNTLSGGAGNDTLDGGTGIDTMNGGAGNDTYILDSDFDSVTEAAGQGIDTIQSNVGLLILGFPGIGNQEIENVYLLINGRDVLANSLDNHITGNDSANHLAGHIGNDTLLGMGSGDALYGETGNDVLDGGSGNDILGGGSDFDTLTGGTGDDRFTFEWAHESSVANPDRITDFTPGAKSFDTIDLSSIDADDFLAGDQAFVFDPTLGASLGANEIVFAHVGADTLVQGDDNGDAVADFAIRLTGNLNLVADDFIL